MDVRSFLVRWFLGPFGDRLGALMLREVGLCRGDMGSCRFSRAPYSVEGFEAVLGVVFKRFSEFNVFVGVGFWLVSSGLAPDQSYMLYDRLAFDFDSEGSPEGAVETALLFSSILSSRYGVDPLVFASGFKGAHVVVPLAKPTDWEGYQLLWNHLYGLVPKDLRHLVDRNMLQWNRLDRVPLTWNVKGGRRALAEIIYPEGVGYDFDWGRLRGLDPTGVTVYRVVLPSSTASSGTTTSSTVTSSTVSSTVTSVVVPASALPSDPAALKDLGWVPPCVRKTVETLITTGELDHYHRVFLVMFLKKLGYTVDACVGLFRRFAKDFRESTTRYHVEYVYGLRGTRVDWSTPSCGKLRGDPKWRGICVADCGVGHPLSYVRRHLGGPNVIGSLPPELADFVKSTGLREFGYEDFRKWLESREGPLDASRWHHYERLLRKWAEEGYLGRKFLVDGQWVDYGPGKISRPPSKEVRFYVVNQPLTGVGGRVS